MLRFPPLYKKKFSLVKKKKNLFVIPRNFSIKKHIPNTINCQTLLLIFCPNMPIAQCPPSLKCPLPTHFKADFSSPKNYNHQERCVSVYIRVVIYEKRIDDNFRVF